MNDGQLRSNETVFQSSSGFEMIGIKQIGSVEYGLWIVDPGLKVEMRGREVSWAAVGYPG